jgi:hypothetical protein
LIEILQWIENCICNRWLADANIVLFISTLFYANAYEYFRDVCIITITRNAAGGTSAAAAASSDDHDHKDKKHDNDKNDKKHKKHHKKNPD